jgi:hypothetical protein
VKSEKEAAELAKQLDQLQADKLKQEEQLKEVMESFKLETGVGNSGLFVVKCY